MMWKVVSLIGIVLLLSLGSFTKLFGQRLSNNINMQSNTAVIGWMHNVELTLAAAANPIFHPIADEDLHASSPTPEKTLILPDADESLALSFSDEFAGAGENQKFSQTWTPNFGADRQLIDNHTLRGNSEQEVYVDKTFAGLGRVPLGLDPFAIHDGVLTITASKTPVQDLDALWGLPFTSGMISSISSWSQTYGYFEMRARLPKGQGVWPAFWLLPYNAWPPELDVMEMLGNQPSVIYVTAHSLAGGKHTSNSHPINMADTSLAFHRYGVLWTPKIIRWYVDRTPVAEEPTPADMTKPMYMIANLAIGGSWPGKTDPQTFTSARMDIDYIRAWRLKDTVN
jgi:beta-glucanase (GH16 family)